MIQESKITVYNGSIDFCRLNNAKQTKNLYVFYFSIDPKVVSTPKAQIATGEKVLFVLSITNPSIGVQLITCCTVVCVGLEVDKKTANQLRLRLNDFIA